MALSPLEENMLEQLIVVAENLSMGRYEENERKIFTMTNSTEYPPVIARLAEAFGMMAVKVGAREYRLEEMIHDLTRAKDDLIIAHERLSLDGLTRIANRWAFSVFLEHEWNRALRSGHSLAAVMIDIDFFKTFNDLYGHLEGDGCLCRVAKALHDSCRRSTDLVARYGGEEFVAILPETTCQQAEALAEIMRVAVADLAIPHQHPAWGHVSISLGVAALQPLPGKTPEELLTLADKALYAAKSEGRNRVASMATIPAMGAEGV